MPWKASLEGDIELREYAERCAVDLHGQPMVNAMRLAAAAVTEAAQKHAKVDTGRWRASITPAVETYGTEVVGIVGSNLAYAPFAHEDTRPHWPPMSALAVWARRHRTTAFVVARAIARRGTKGDHAITRAVEEKEDLIERLIGAGVDTVLEKGGK